MRKALLALALVVASFAGGAAINGPGLKWARAWLAPGGDEPRAVPVLDDQILRPRAGADTLAKDDPPAAIDADPTADPEPDTRPADEPEPASIAQARSKPEPKSGPDPGPAVEPPAPLTMPEPSRTPGAGWGDAPGSAPAAAATPPAAPPAPLDPEARPAALPDAAPKADAGAAQPAADDAGWPEVARQLKELGVGRYWIEGEPGGPAVFRCVVPLAGRRAVGQQFEAEADDPLAAARAALRRLQLWRATRPAGEG